MSLDRPGPGKAYLVGICGIGMAGLARLLIRQGWSVSGSDLHPNELAEWLRGEGVALEPPGELPGVNWVIRSTAVPDSDPAVRKAFEKGIPVVRRGEVLAAVMSARPSVAVCGTHGKTTTSCFTTRLLQLVGEPVAWCIGGNTKQLGAVAGGGDGLLVAESDESDGTLAGYSPSVTVITNIDLDHLEHFDGESDLVHCFEKAAKQTRERVIACIESPRAVGAAGPGAFTYGFADGADLRAEILNESSDSVTFAIFEKGADRGVATIPVAGLHNVLNMLAALSVGAVLGYPVAELLRHVPAAAGELPARRFELMAQRHGYRVIADYAHHPVEIAAAVRMGVLQGAKRLRIVFQPHRYTRTLALGPEFPAAFAGADEVILCPVYAASEAPIEGGDSFDLYAQFRTASEKAPLLARSCGEASDYLRRTVRSGDLIMVIGAGDVIEIAKRFRDDPPASAEEGTFVPSQLAAWSFYGTGGCADRTVEIADEAQLAEVLRGGNVRFVGLGSNSWFSDLGEPGTAARFAGGTFCGYGIDGTEVSVGAGLKGAALLALLEQNGLGGLEFMEGIPGTVGGWVRMNAGAHGGEIGSRVKSVRLFRNGGFEEIAAGAIRFLYRRTEGLEGIITAVKFVLEKAAPDVIRARREEIRRKRIALGGLRTCGSMFKNPPGDAAGRLIDAAGLKGFRIGGARVWEKHGNIIVSDPGATSSDILALMMFVRDRVRRRSGIELICEVTGF